MSLSNTSHIIQKFELFVGDETELSSAEELDLLQKIYNQVLESHEWEFLKKEASGTVSTSLDYLSAPADFASFIKNYDDKRVVYIGSNYEPYYVIPYNERRMYRNQSGFVYFDARQDRITFTKQPTVADSYEFDYIYVPSALDTTSSNPVFPVRFWDILYHGMCVDNDIIQMSEKARSYQRENQTRYDQLLSNMKYWNDTISGYDTY